MVQIKKDKVAKHTLGKDSASRVKKLTGHRRAAPQKRKVSPTDAKVSTAINKNIEKLMAARVSHEGGHLSLVKAPKNVTEFAKSGPKLSQLQVKLRAGQNAIRKRKADEHNALVQTEVVKIEKLSKERLEILKRRRRGPIVDTQAPELDDDDVAGPFFLEADEALNEEEEIKPKTTTISQSMPARSAGFKGVHSKKAASILEEDF